MAFGWSDVIGLGLGYLGAKKQTEATERAAEQQAEALKEAAIPRSVYDPMGAAVYDPTTDSYRLQLSPQAQALQSGLFYDAMRERQKIEPLLRPGGLESEAARRSRAEEALIKQATQEALQDVTGKYLKKGTLGTTMGAAGLAEVARKGAEAGISSRERQRGLLSAEIADALNRASAARQGATGLSAYPQALSTIGQGMAGNMLTATSAAANPILAAQRTAASAMAQPYYQLSGLFSRAVPRTALSTPEQEAIDLGGFTTYTGGY